jgi:hypothetical protein
MTEPGKQELLQCTFANRSEPKAYVLSSELISIMSSGAGNPTRLLGFFASVLLTWWQDPDHDGLVPGRTFMMTKGIEAIVRFVNHGDRANPVPLHESYSRAPFDGWTEDTTGVGQYKDYYYPNSQNARTLWYHVDNP